MNVLLIDNYDSFTYNLVHVLEPLVDKLTVCRNDEFEMESVASYDKIIISPGPSLPDEAGQLMELIKTYHKKIPMLGVCLGFQAMVEFFDGELINLNPVRHGESKKITIFEHVELFKDVTSPIEVGLYHSWGLKTINLPESFVGLAEDSDGVSMAFRHQLYPMWGVQFHPESIMTPAGSLIIKNWINI